MSLTSVSSPDLPASEPNPAPAQTGHLSQGEDDNLEKVRELLFGQQARSSEQQLQNLETELVRFKGEFEDRLQRLEDIINQGFDSITQQIQVERDDRKAAIARCETATQTLGDDLQQKTVQLEQKIDQKAQGLQQEVLAQSSQLTEALHQASQGFLRDLNQESQRRQQQERAHNSRLAGLFGELSERLND